MKEMLLAASGVASAVAASTCCFLPLALVSVGVSGAWVGALTVLAPYQPLFLAIAVAALGGGFWLVYRRARRVRDHMCNGAGRLIKNTLLVKGVLWLGAALVALSVGADYGIGLFS